MIFSKKCCALLFMLVLACGQVEGEVEHVHTFSEPASEEDTGCGMPEVHGADASFPCEDNWICHSPSTKMHNQVCTSECMVPGDSRTYCWLKECHR